MRRVPEEYKVADRILRGISVDPSWNLKKLRRRIVRALRRASHEGSLNPYC